MTSQVNPNNIDGTYPVAGQDNDSQGFRDNFTNIRNNLTYVKAEIEDIQNKAIFKTALSNTTLDNDFYGNIVSNPSFTAWRETYNNIGSTSGAVIVNFANGNFQKLTMAGSVTLSFSFPTNTNTQYASIKLWIVNTNASYTLTLPSTLTLGDPDTIAGLAGSPPVITFSAAEIANNADYLFEIFTVDGGTTLGIKDLVRNRDIDLSGMQITGNLNVDRVFASANIVTSANLVTTNGIFWAANGQPYSTTAAALNTSGTVIAAGNIVAGSSTNNAIAGDTTIGSLISKGSAGIEGNVNINGNLWINSGNIRSTGTIANIFNISMQTISMGNAATNIFMGASTGTIVFGNNLRVTGTGSRFLADFTNATVTNRLNFQTSTVNSATGIYALPSGSSTAASWQATNNSDPTNASKILIATNGTTDVQLVSGINGTGTYLPLTFYTNGIEQVKLDTTGNMVVKSTVTSTSQTTGALVVAGGVGIAGNLFANSNVILGGGTISNVVANATTTSTSTTTGALVVSGGVGIAGNLFTGGNIVAATATASTNTTTGALVVSGGAGIAGNLNLGISSTTVVPLAFAATQTTGGNVNVPIQGAVEANIGVGATGTAANVFYATPTNATSSGRALVPVTHYYALGSNVALNNGSAPTGTASYSIFGGPVAASAWIGNVMLAAGTTYEFDIKSMVSMAAAPTASTLAFTFQGNATTTYYNYEVTVYPVGGTISTTANTTQVYGTTAFPALTVTASPAQAWTNFAVRSRGIVRTNAQGTVVPVLVWATGPAQVATAVQGSYMKFTPIGTAANVAIGFSTGTPFL